MTNTHTEVSFRRDPRAEESTIPPCAWTELTTDGNRIVIRTSRPTAVVAALGRSGAELAELEVRSTRPPDATHP